MFVLCLVVYFRLVVGIWCLVVVYDVWLFRLMGFF